ncbi:MAG: hypothetical protein LBU85_08820 [Treponema sp.]|jgi:group I intron endonuclease|nr:hypothetical protein [Treponema sp.]
MAYGIIYKAAGPDGRVYIGKTIKTVAKRKCGHLYRAKLKDRRTAFQRALLVEGAKNFQWEEIDHAETAEELNEKEINWIAYYKADDPAYGYNAQSGGDGGIPNAETRKKLSLASKGKPKSEEHRRNIGEAKKGEKHPFYGKHFSEEYRRKMSDAQKGKVFTEEHRRKLREAAKNISPEHRRRISEAIKGEKNGSAKITEETARQIKFDLQNGMRICDIAIKYRINKGIVSNIKHSKAWAWVQIGA